MSGLHACVCMEEWENTFSLIDVGKTILIKCFTLFPVTCPDAARGCARDCGESPWDGAQLRSPVWCRHHERGAGEHRLWASANHWETGPRAALGPFRLAQLKQHAFIGKYDAFSVFKARNVQMVFWSQYSKRPTILLILCGMHIMHRTQSFCARAYACKIYMFNIFSHITQNWN